MVFFLLDLLIGIRIAGESEIRLSEVLISNPARDDKPQVGDGASSGHPLTLKIWRPEVSLFLKN